MKAILEFNLPEDQNEFDLANNAAKLSLFAWKFQQYLRSQIKYADKPDDIDEIYEKWFEMMRTDDIDLESLVL